MTCNHLPSVTCDGCQHVRSVPSGTPMSLNQAAWSAGWAEGYQAGMQFVNNAAESEIERLRNERDELRACLLWYVESDDNHDLVVSVHNAVSVKLKHRAMRALGLRSEDE